MAKDILVIAETDEGAPTSLTLEMLGLASRLKDSGSVNTIVLGNGIDGIGDTLIAFGADHVFAGDNETFAPYMADAWFPDITKVVQETDPELILCAHTTIGWDLAPRLAFRLDTGIATGCEAVERNDDKILMTRACYGGKAREQISFTTSSAVATIKSKSQEALKEDTARTGEVTALQSVLVPDQIRAWVISQKPRSRRRRAPRNRQSGGRRRRRPRRAGRLHGGERTRRSLGWCCRREPGCLRARLVPAFLAGRTFREDGRPGPLYRDRHFGCRAAYGGLR